MKKNYFKPTAELIKIEVSQILVGSKGPGSGNGQGQSSIPGGAAKDAFFFNDDNDNIIED